MLVAGLPVWRNRHRENGRRVSSSGRDCRLGRCGDVRVDALHLAGLPPPIGSARRATVSRWVSSMVIANADLSNVTGQKILLRRLKAHLRFRATSPSALLGCRSSSPEVSKSTLTTEADSSPRRRGTTSSDPTMPASSRSTSILRPASKPKLPLPFDHLRDDHPTSTAESLSGCSAELGSPGTYISRFAPRYARRLHSACPLHRRPQVLRVNDRLEIADRQRADSRREDCAESKHPATASAKCLSDESKLAWEARP